MTRLQEQILKVLKFSGDYKTSAFIAGELNENTKNVSARLSEMKSVGMVGLDKDEGGYFVNPEWKEPKKKEKKDPFIELDKLNLISCDNREEKLIVLGRLKSMFTRCNLNAKLHSVIDEIVEDYKLLD